MRVGIFGGTFNPIHFGHLRSAEEVGEALALDHVRFIPTALPPHKSMEEVAPALDRLEMVRLAVEENPAFVCDPIEVERGGKSYTVDTLMALSEGSCKGASLYFIVGVDAFLEIHAWREPGKILQMANFCVTLRIGQEPNDLLETARRALTGVKASLTLEQVEHNKVQIIETKMIIDFKSISNFDISATDIRQKAAAGASLQYLLPRSAELFIIRRGLYGAVDSGARFSGTRGGN